MDSLTIPRPKIRTELTDHGTTDWDIPELSSPATQAKTRLRNRATSTDKGTNQRNLSRKRPNTPSRRNITSQERRPNTLPEGRLNERQRLIIHLPHTTNLNRLGAPGSVRAGNPGSRPEDREPSRQTNPCRPATRRKRGPNGITVKDPAISKNRTSPQRRSSKRTTKYKIPPGTPHKNQKTYSK